jgi:hypothetical protein
MALRPQGSDGSAAPHSSLHNSVFGRLAHSCGEPAAPISAERTRNFYGYENECQSDFDDSAASSSHCFLAAHDYYPDGANPNGF